MSETVAQDTKPKLLVLIGLPASGKTTFARGLAESGWMRVSVDDINRSLFGGKSDKMSDAFSIALRDEIIIRGLVSGYNVVVDDTNLDPSHIEHFKSIASEFMAEYEEKRFDTPLDECIRRNHLRGSPVADEYITSLYDKYIVGHEPEEKDEAIIVDIDGTLAHISNGRSPYDASTAIEDEVDDAISVITAMAYKNGYKVFIVTGRSDEHRQVTVDWLERNGVPYDELYMREDGDDGKDELVKRDIYFKYIEPKYKVKFVLEDRDRVVAMWRRLGLKCLQVQEGDF